MARDLAGSAAFNAVTAATVTADAVNSGNFSAATTVNTPDISNLTRLRNTLKLMETADSPDDVQALLKWWKAEKGSS